jgi:broad specificity phosphatase PhoE
MKLDNTYFILRHGEAVSNVKQIYSSWPEKFRNPLTKNGKRMIQEVTKTLKNNHATHGKAIDMIFASDLLRTKQTAEIVGKSLKLKVKFDKRLREVDFKKYNGQLASHFYYTDLMKEKEKGREGESYAQIKKRVGSFLKDLNATYKGKHILLVSHQCPLWILEKIAKGLPIRKEVGEERIGRGQLRQLN